MFLETQVAQFQSAKQQEASRADTLAAQVIPPPLMHPGAQLDAIVCPALYCMAMSLLNCAITENMFVQLRGLELPRFDVRLQSCHAVLMRFWLSVQVARLQSQLAAAQLDVQTAREQAALAAIEGPVRALLLSSPYGNSAVCAFLGFCKGGMKPCMPSPDIMPTAVRISFTMRCSSKHEQPCSSCKHPLVTH